MARLLCPAVDVADIYFQSTHYESWVLEAGIIKEGSHSIEQGAGVRAVSGDKPVLHTATGLNCRYC